MPVYIWDASDYDWNRGPMDLAAAKAAGISVFTHKATEGTTIQHVHLADGLNRARAAGIDLIGAYIVPRTPGNKGHGQVWEQVDYLLRYLDQAVPWWDSWPGFFLQVDTEHWGYDDVSPVIGAEVCQELRKATGRWVIHYAPKWAYGDTIPGGDPLWASSYGGNPAVPFDRAYPGDSAPGWTPYSGRTPTFLQYGSHLTIGAQPTADVSAFRGTLDELRALITGGTMTSTRTTNFGVAELDAYSDGDLIAAILTNYDPSAASGKRPINGLQQVLAAVIAKLDKIPASAAAVDPAGFVAALGANPAVLDQLAGAFAGHFLDLLIQIAASAHITPTTPATPHA